MPRRSSLPSRPFPSISMSSSLLDTLDTLDRLYIHVPGDLSCTSRLPRGKPLCPRTHPSLSIINVPGLWLWNFVSASGSYGCVSSSLSSGALFIYSTSLPNYYGSVRISPAHTIAHLSLRYFISEVIANSLIFKRVERLRALPLSTHRNLATCASPTSTALTKYNRRRIGECRLSGTESLFLVYLPPKSDLVPEYLEARNRELEAEGKEKAERVLGAIADDIRRIYGRHVRQNATQNSNPNQYNENEGGRGFQGASLPNSSQQFSQSQSDPFGLTALANSLPDATYQNYSNAPAQRYSSGPSPSPLMYQFPNVPQFANQQLMGQPYQNMQYGMGYQSQYQGIYGQGQTQQPHLQQAALSNGSQFYQGQGFIGQQQQMSPPFMIQAGQYGVQGQVYPVSSSGSYGARGGFLGEARQPGQPRGNEYLSGSSAGGTPGRASSIASSPTQSSVVRGPPRKPRQSGHAIWIGNLPPQTDLMSLVLHVCKETVGLESLFLISKSNCAFANFKDEAACAAAQVKIHDSRFQTVRLVSRLRRNSVGTAAGVTVPTGPAALTPPSNPMAARGTTPNRDTKPKEREEEAVESKSADESGGSNGSKDKFFIVKSLTVEDLELSVRNGIWATQSHNEEALNKAYQTADNVYLIFSANKSGEYFGYAKMISPINDDPAAAIEFAPKAHTVEDPELPKAIPTPASEFAPKGRIIDDSERGTIFWEVERDETDGVDEEDESQSNRSDEDPESKTSSKAWGKPFQVEWVSTTRLPFYRTRGLRNPWNSNREVKIARDGTELEGGVGRRLLGLFHRLPSPVAPNMPAIYPQMRQF